MENEIPAIPRINSIDLMETSKLLEILYASLQLYKNGMIDFTLNDVIEQNKKNGACYNKESTVDFYEKALDILHQASFFSKKYIYEEFKSYSFVHAKLNYLK
jgi:hypothetical protein